MLVSRSTFDSIVEKLRTTQRFLSLDTETTGLRPYHGDRLFSLILGYQGEDGKPDAAYFNFWPSYPSLASEYVLPKSWLKRLAPLFDDPEMVWFIHKFNFDMHMLSVEGIELAGQVHCTQNQGRVEFNEHWNYDLASSLKRIGLAKDDRVSAWIKENKASEKVKIPGKKTEIVNEFYFKVPPEIIVPYGLDDARGGFALGVSQEASIAKQAEAFPEGAQTPVDAMRIERRLAKTVYRMEKVGVRIDREYCARAIAFETDRADKAGRAFTKETGRPYSASAKLFEVVFASERSKWGVTEKGNPSFDSDTLKTFENPAAKAALTLRDAKSRLDFYHGFLWHADANGDIHPNFTPGGTRTFRFSSSNPNLQNLTSEDATICRACKTSHEEYVDRCPECDSADIEHPEFMVRRALVPRPGFLWLMPDYDQMEYKMMLDYAKHMMIVEFKKRRQAWDEAYFEVANKVRDGFDVHKATAEMMGVSRKYAKTLNFLLIYGGRTVRLAMALLHPTLSETALWAVYKHWKGFPKSRWEPMEEKLFALVTPEQYDHNLALLQQSEALIRKYFEAVPYVEFMVNTVTSVVKERGWIRNWAGYKYHFPDRNFAYTGPNTIIQGGTAAVTKKAMNEIDEYLLTKKSRLVLTIHDELPTECHESEVHEVPRRIKELMESVYPHKYIPLTAGMEWSSSSLADKRKGFPT